MNSTYLVNTVTATSPALTRQC